MRRLMTVAAAVAIGLLCGPAAGDIDGLETYGFYDIEAEIGNKDEAAERGSFDQHHLTVVWSARLNPRFRVLFETAFEHGPTLKAGSGEGKIYLPKAYTEYSQSDAFRMRAGKFLPPFGIYNERHDATPTLIPTVLPQSVYGKHLNLAGALSDSLGQKVRAYPRFATGLWMLGRAWVGSWELEYHGYLSNGRGANSNEKDDNDNKGLGARVVLSPGYGIRIGASWYGDTNGELNDARQEAIGFDIEYERANLLLEAGSILPRMELLAADGTRSGEYCEPFGWYVMAGYTLWDRTTPFAYYDRYDPDRELGGDQSDDITIGVNHALADGVFLKSEVHFIEFESSSRNGYQNFVSSLAVTF